MGSSPPSNINDPYIWVRTRGFLGLCLALATAYVVVLGIPTYLLLRKLNAIRWWSAIAAGFILGSIPAAIVGWPLRFGELHTSASFDSEELDAIIRRKKGGHAVLGASHGYAGSKDHFFIWNLQIAAAAADDKDLSHGIYLFQVWGGDTFLE